MWCLILFCSSLLLVFPQLKSDEDYNNVEEILAAYADEDPYDEVATIVDEIPAKSDVAEASFIFLHGVGDSGVGIQHTIEKILPPHVRAILPTANPIPITNKQKLRMRAWFDLNDRIKEDLPGVEKAEAYVRTLIEEEIEKNIPPERIIVGGYAQGGAIAVHTANGYPHKLGGAIVFSTWKQLRMFYIRPRHPANADIPILECKLDGTENDPKDNSNVTFELFNGHDHHLTFKELDQIKQFFDKHVPKIYVEYDKP